MRLIEDHLDEDWYEESLEASPIMLGMPAHSVGGGLEPLQKQYMCALCFLNKKKLHWFTLVSDQDLISRQVLQNYMRDKNYYKKWLGEWKRRRKKFLLIFRKVVNIDLSELSDKELLQLYKRYWGAAFACRRISMMIDGYVFGAERRMANELQDYCLKKKISNYNKIYAQLTAPEEESIINKYELELINIAKVIKKSRKLRLLLNKPKELSKLPLVKNHLSRYRWIKGNWYYSYPYKIEYFIDEIKQLLTKDIKKLHKMKKQIVKKHREQRQKLLKKYKFNKVIRALSDLTVFMAMWQDLRKEKALKFINGQTLFAHEFAHRLKIKVSDMLNIDHKESLTLLKYRKKLLHVVKKRREIFILLYTNGKVYPSYGPKVRYYLKKVREIPGAKDVSDIKGMSAFPGKARGRVRIAYELKEFRKFKKGDILVTGMTRPDYAVVMKKAAAIVTDDGGITCHAAIVARELKTPCIVGTRIATKVLKDNNVVEVDADKGVVKILKK